MVSKMETGSDWATLLPRPPAVAPWQVMDIPAVVGHPSEGGIVGLGTWRTAHFMPGSVLGHSTRRSW